jgi:DNA replication and repair protein RecF
MILDLRLQSYRSYEDDAFEFGNGVNIIVGPNGAGKTNLLEALLVMCRGGSYRVKDVDLIQFDKPWARLECDTTEGKRTVTLERNGTTANKKYVLNSVNYKRLVLNKTLPVVVFEPEHLRLLNGGPERRREYMDNLLEQTISGYGTLRREYKRTLAQRNKLLKTIGHNNDELFVWNVRLCDQAGKIVQYRIKLIEKLNSDIESLYQQLSQTKTNVSLGYSTSCSLQSYGSDMLRKLEQCIDEDRLRGFTTHGPHRDDMAVIINNHPASVSASRGESRTLLLTLKILELQLLEKSRDKKPLLLLDDVFSELDGSRRKALTSFLQNYQTFITTTDADIVVQHFMNNCQILPISR